MSTWKPCDWKYQTTKGLTMSCVRELDHDGDHRDEAGRDWRVRAGAGGGTAYLVEEAADA